MPIESNQPGTSGNVPSSRSVPIDDTDDLDKAGTGADPSSPSSSSGTVRSGAFDDDDDDLDSAGSGAARNAPSSGSTGGEVASKSSGDEDEVDDLDRAGSGAGDDGGLDDMASVAGKGSFDLDDGPGGDVDEDAFSTFGSLKSALLDDDDDALTSRSSDRLDDDLDGDLDVPDDVEDGLDDGAVDL